MHCPPIPPRARVLPLSPLATALCRAVCGAMPFAAAAAQEPAWATLHSAQQRVVVVDNSPVKGAWWCATTPHQAGLNGLGLLAHGLAERNLLVPWLAGINFEHIFSGDSTSYAWPRYAPRTAPMTLSATVPDQRIDLVQPSAGNWPLSTVITFQRAGPEAIDFRVVCTPFANVWSKYGYIGIFFATYVYRPDDGAIHFIGRSRPGMGSQTPRWIRHESPAYAVQMNQRPAGSTWDPPYDPGFHMGLVTAFSSSEYLYPFFAGFTGGKVLLFMFDPPPTGELRFAQAPNGGGFENPAWDFFYMERQFAIGQPFTLRGRLLCKSFVSAEDLIHTYEQWSGKTVIRP